MKKLYVIVSLFFVVAFLSACGTEPKQGSKGEEKSATPKLTIYTSQPEEDTKQVLAEFKKLYPEIETEFFRSGTEEVMVKLMAEKEKNVIAADILWIADDVTMQNLKAQNMLLSYDAKEAVNGEPSVMDKDKYYFGTKVISAGIAYHTENCPRVPKSFADLLDPVYKEHLVIPSPLYSGSASYQLSAFIQNENFGLDYYKALKEQKVFVGKGNGSVKNTILSGERSVGILIDFMAIKAKESGEKIDFVYPEEGVMVITEPVAILNTTKNRDAAQKFVEFILSRAGQELIAAQGYTPIRKDVKPLPNRVPINELNIMPVDSAGILKEREANKEQFKQLFQE